MPTSSPSWRTTAITNVTALTGADRTFYAALASGRVLRSKDGGASWSVHWDAGPTVLSGLFAYQGILLADSLEGPLRLDANGDALSLPGVLAVRGVAGTSTGHVLVMGTGGGGVFRSEDAGATWTGANAGLPFEGTGLSVSSVVGVEGDLFAAHQFGISRSRNAGQRWEPAGFGLPLRFRRASVVASASRLFAVVDHLLFRLVGEEWLQLGRDAVTVLGADARALYALDARGDLLQLFPEAGTQVRYGDGLPAPPTALALGATAHLALLPSGRLWRCLVPAQDGPAQGVPAGVPEESRPGPWLSEVAVRWPERTVTTSFHLPAPAHVHLEILSADEKHVQLLASQAYAAGSHRVTASADTLGAGFYRCRITVGRQVLTRPFAVIPLFS